MESKSGTKIQIEAIVNASMDKVWSYWSEPAHITKWNNASEDWHTPHAAVDLRTGGRFMSRMEARDGSWGFDFGGVYTTVRVHEYIAYTMDDDRKVDVKFEAIGAQTKVTEVFEAEAVHTIEQQQSGWQAILDNFKKYTESN